MKEPTGDQCSARTDLESPPNEPDVRRFAAWHPQWGGYGSHCVVQFGIDRRADSERGLGESDSLPCFEVYNWHNGEFPADEACRLHYCDPLQLVEFGALIIEKMFAAGVKPSARIVARLKEIGEEFVLTGNRLIP